jgi:hypothetical protein
MKSLISAVVLSVALGGIATAWAETSTPAPMSSDQKTSSDQKKAISKSCTDQANAKGLHGKARKKFRSECKQNGGKPAQ